MAAGPRGSFFKLLGKVESSENTAPSGNWAQLPCYSFDMSAAQEYEDDPVLSLTPSRFMTDPTLGPLNIAGTAVVPMDTGNLSFWLTALFGASSSSGSGPTTLTWKPATTLSSYSLEKGMADEAKYFVYTGIKANTLSIPIGPDGPQRMSIGLIGRGGTAAGSSAGGTATVATFGRIMSRMCAVTVGGSAPAKMISGEINITNNLDAYRTVRDDSTGAVSDIDPGLVGVSGSFTLRSADAAAHADAIAGTARELVFTFTKSAGTTIVVTVERAFLSRPSMPIAGPDGIQQTYTWRGAYDSGATSPITIAYTVP
jgi:hypothetical protein